MTDPICYDPVTGAGLQQNPDAPSPRPGLEYNSLNRRSSVPVEAATIDEGLVPVESVERPVHKSRKRAAIAVPDSQHPKAHTQAAPATPSTTRRADPATAPKQPKTPSSSDELVPVVDDDGNILKYVARPKAPQTRPPQTPQSTPHPARSEGQTPQSHSRPMPYQQPDHYPYPPRYPPDHYYPPPSMGYGDYRYGRNPDPRYYQDQYARGPSYQERPPPPRQEYFPQEMEGVEHGRDRRDRREDPQGPSQR